MPTVHGILCGCYRSGFGFGPALGSQGEESVSACFVTSPERVAAPTVM